MQNHSITSMDKLFQVSEGLGANKCMCDVVKYANYLTDELRMEFYLRMMRTLTRKGDCIFNVSKGSIPIYAAIVSNFK